MSDSQEGEIHKISGGGISGTHPEEPSFQLIVAPSTANEINTARLRLIPIACWKVEDIRFAFDSSFVTPDIVSELKELVALREKHKKQGLLAGQTQYPPLSVFGHADPVGDDSYNKALSGRRAAVIYGLLISRTDPVKAANLWGSVARDENWGDDQRRIMQSITGLPEGTPNSQLFQPYMKSLCPEELSLTDNDFLAQGKDSKGKGDYQGCSSFNPLLIFSQKREDQFEEAQRDGDEAGVAARNMANGPNRRVMILLFRVGSKIDPSRWPCPRAGEGTAGCIRRFWSDAQQRRGKRLQDKDRQFQESRHTFACRFDHRLLSGSPCERTPVACPWCALMSHVPPNEQKLEWECPWCTLMSHVPAAEQTVIWE